jgi:hypothetical protein
MYSIWQNKISKEAIDVLNNVGWGGDHGSFDLEIRIQRDVKCFGSEKFTADMMPLFKRVATVEANDLDEVFHIGNVCKGSMNVLHKMHSISVGDIIVDETTNTSYMVDPFGFTEVKEAA